jgi:hypothetical protein
VWVFSATERRQKLEESSPVIELPNNVNGVRRKINKVLNPDQVVPSTQPASPLVLQHTEAGFICNARSLFQLCEDEQTHPL